MKNRGSIARTGTAILAIALLAVLSPASSEQGRETSRGEAHGTAELDAAGGVFPKKKYGELLEHDRAGTAAYNKNDFKSAQKEFALSIGLSAEIFGENSVQTAHRLNSLGLAHYHQGEYDSAIDNYGKALAVYRRIKGEGSLQAAFCLQGLGQCYQFKGEYDRAIGLYAKALDAYNNDSENNRTYIGTALYDTGVAYQYKGEYGRAEGYFNRSLDICLNAFGPDHAYLATIYYALGETAKFRGNFNSALEQYRKALDVYRGAHGDNHPYVATVYYAMGFAHENRGEFETSVSCYERARKIYTETYGERHPHVAIAYHGLGNIYNTMGEHEKAIAGYNKAVEIYLAIFGENHVNTAASLHGLGNSCVSLGQYDRALGYYERVLAIHRTVLGDNHPETGHSYAGIGMVLARTGDYDRALRNFEKARSVFAANLGENHPNVSGVLLQEARLYYTRDDFARGRDLAEKALAQYRGKSLHPQTITASNVLGVMYLYAGEPRKARPCFDESIGAIEKARIEAGADKVEFMRRYINAYYYSLKSSALMGDTEAVFGTAEAMRARGFLDRMSLSTALSVEGILKADRERLMALNDDIEALASRRSAEIRKPSPDQDSAALVRISKELEQKEKAFSELEARLMANERYRRLRKPHIATLDEARRICGTDSAILEYVIWEEKDRDSDAFAQKQSYCLVITGSGQKLVALDRDFDYTAAVARFRDSIIDRNKKKDREALGVLLYDKLIAPVEREIGAIKNIIIIPDGALAFLPFDALRIKAGGPYLCESYTVTLSPSVSVMLMVQKRRYSSGRKAFLAFGGAVYSTGKGEKRGLRRSAQPREVTVKSKEYYADEGSRGRPLYYRNLGLQWDNIPGTLDEVNDIDNNVYKKEKTRVIRGSAVSESKIKELSRKNELMKYKSVHFACHGYFDADLPSYSAVVMSEVSGAVKSPEDGYLSVPEVALMKLQADIVNLSACETGLGRIVQGDGVVGLARAFQEAGANRVGVTLWEVADEPTRIFMVGVYRRAVLMKMPFGAAVSETKREFIRSREFGDPYFWSAFVLYGR